MDAEGVINLITPSDTCTVNLMERGVRHQFDGEIGRNADEFRDAKGQINLIYPLDTCVIKLAPQARCFTHFLTCAQLAHLPLFASRQPGPPRSPQA